MYDQGFRTLLDLRNPQYPNPLKNRICGIELSREPSQSLDVAFQLNGLPGVFALSASVDQRLIIRTELEF